MKNEKKYSPYRWVIIALYFLVTVAIEIHWLSFASISEAAREYYGITTLQVDFFSVIYMLIFIVLSIPASLFLDRYGLRKGLVTGAVITAVFSVTKWLFAESYLAVAISQTGLAIAQPFILNAVTKVGAAWFPANERATVVGIGSLAQYIGIIIALALTPELIVRMADGTYQIQSMLFVYGLVGLAASLLLILFFRKADNAPSQSTPGERPFHGILAIFKIADMRKLLVMFFVGLGIFNAVSTCIDQICGHLTMEQTGVVGGVMLVGGVVGALIIPAWSDKIEQRKPFLIIAMAALIPGLAGLTFLTAYVPLMIASFFFGFFIMGAGPVGFQYGAEKSYPAPESISQGLILMVGQVSGILFVFGVNTFGVYAAMVSFIVLIVFNFFLTFRLSESFVRQN